MKQESEFELEYLFAVRDDPNYAHLPRLTRAELHRLAVARAKAALADPVSWQSQVKRACRKEREDAAGREAK